MTEIWTAKGAEKILTALRIEKVEDAWKPGFPGELVNDRGDRQVIQIQIQEWERAIYLKRWRFPPGSPARFLPGKGPLKNRGANEFENLKALASLGIKVPTPLFFGEERGLFGPVASILGLEDLAGYVCSLDWGKDHPEGLQAVGRGMGSILGNLHAAGIFHRSPGLKHFYLDASDPNAPFAMLDVPRLDRAASETPSNIRHRLGMEFPCRERDLSKTLLAIRGAFPNAEVMEHGLWDGYLAVLRMNEDPSGLRTRVEQWTQNRRVNRENRATRKS